jgi:hypothetical protein
MSSLLPYNLKLKQSGILTNTSNIGTTTFSLADSNSASNCSITQSSNGTIITGNKVGVCKVVVNNTGNSNYNPTTSTISVNVNKISQPTLNLTISGLTINSSNGYNLNITQTYTLQLANMLETPTITYSIVNITSSNQIVSINDNTIKGTNIGQCIIQATTSETTSYLSTNTQIVINVIKLQNNFVMSSLPTLTYNQSIDLKSYISTLNNSDIITYTLNNSSNSSISGSVITPRQIGTLSINASVPASNNYNALSTNISLQIQQATQPITTISISGVILSGSNTYTININTTNTLQLNNYLETPTITFISSDSSICSISGTILTARASGTCTIRANINATTNYRTSTSQSITINVQKLQNTLLTSSLPSISYGELLPLLINTKSTATTTYNINDSNSAFNCSLIQSSNQTSIRGNNAGTCSINYNNPGDTINSSISGTISIKVNKINQSPLVINLQTIQGFTNVEKFTDMIDTINIKLNEQLKFNVISDSSTPTRFTCNSSDCIINNNIVSFTNPGTYIVSATNNGDNNYNPISKDITVIVSNIISSNQSSNNLLQQNINLLSMTSSMQPMSSSMQPMSSQMQPISTSSNYIYYIILIIIIFSIIAGYFYFTNQQ